MDRRLPALGGWPVREYQGVKMSWVELDRIVSQEILRDDDIRRRVAESGRSLRSHATGMSDDDLLAKLRGLGVDADREKLAELCDGVLSAEEVVSERLGLHDLIAARDVILDVDDGAGPGEAVESGGRRTPQAQLRSIGVLPR